MPVGGPIVDIGVTNPTFRFGVGGVGLGSFAEEA